MKARYAAIASLLLVACADDVGAPAQLQPADDVTADSGADTGVEDATPEVAEPAPGVVETEPEPSALGACEYINLFSSDSECKAYTGAAWTLEDAEADCAVVQFGQGPVFVAGGSCGFEEELGQCMVGEEELLGYTLHLAGSDPASCGIAAGACEGFGGGTFTANPVCDEEPAVNPAPSGGFVWPYQDCREPLEGEEPGVSEGLVCTNTLISACTEEGRRFVDYASCDDVTTQRPYYAYAAPAPPDDDPRIDDEEYMGELDWVTEQVEACACTCCHSDDAPAGASGWTIDAGELWLDTVDDDGLAMLAGLADSSAFGAYPADENNGFDRATTGLPTTDVDRMQTFLVEEYLRRGNTLEEGREVAPFGGPLYSQLTYEPSACRSGDGFDADGNLNWPSNARYVYVLEQDSANPAVPPNFDLPEGTLWRVDVRVGSRPMQAPLAYGDIPDGALQYFPDDGEPTALVSGETYFVVALGDIGIPLIRCLAEFP